jgi:hypothetical protein
VKRTISMGDGGGEGGARVLQHSGRVAPRRALDPGEEPVPARKSRSSSRLGCRVDLVMRDAVKRQLRDRIFAEAVRAT